MLSSQGAAAGAYKSLGVPVLYASLSSTVIIIKGYQSIQATSPSFHRHTCIASWSAMQLQTMTMIALATVHREQVQAAQ